MVARLDVPHRRQFRRPPATEPYPRAGPDRHRRHRPLVSPGRRSRAGRPLAGSGGSLTYLEIPSALGHYATTEEPWKWAETAKAFLEARR